MRQTWGFYILGVATICVGLGLGLNETVFTYLSLVGVLVVGLSPLWAKDEVKVRKKALHEHFVQVLTRAMELRPQPGYIQFEREAMFSGINIWRRKLGKHPISIETVERVEALAVGHSDYVQKYALYCTELVLDSLT